MATSRRRERHHPSDPSQHARAIAEMVDQTWHRSHGSGDIEIAVSTVAALAFLSPPADEIDDVAAQITALALDQFADLVRLQWRIFVRYRPDLVNRAWLLITPWWGEHPIDDTTIKSAKEVADSALRAGLLHLTGTLRRREVDLFGHVLTVMRSRTARAARGQFYTPAPVTDLMAQMLGAPQEGESVHEPAAGTGGFLRSVAQAMRDVGRDPATITWVAVDIDELAIAALAVNVVLWELGPTVILGVGNALTDDWMHRAIGERNETISIAQTARALAMVETLLRPIDAAGS